MNSFLSCENGNGKSLFYGNYRCSKCSYQSTTRGTLLNHLQMIHSGDQDFQVTCGINKCEASYRLVNSLKKHIRRKHGDTFLHSELNKSSQLSDIAIGNHETFHADAVTNETISESPSTAATYLNGVPRDQSYLSHTFTLMQLKLKHLHTVPASIIDTVSTEILQLLKVYNDTLFSELNSHFQKVQTKCSKNCERTAQLQKLRQDQDMLIDSLLSCSTINSQYSFAKEHLGLVVGKKIVLGKENNKEDVFYYVPILQTLESLLKHEDVLSEVKNGHASLDKQILCDYCDGSLYSQNELFASDPSSLQIQLYFDDFEIVNPLGSYTKRQKLSACYFLLGNIRPMFRSKLKLIQLVWLCKSENVKKYGLDQVVSPLISDLSQLESVGLHMTISGSPEIFKGTVTMIVADNLASHSMGGFNESFSGLRICRFCMCTSQELSEGCVPKILVERTRSCYDEHVKLIEADENLKTTYGVRKNSPFNQLQYFHVSEGLPPDIAHDLFEGVCPIIMGKVLTKFVCNKIISVEKINDVICNFPYKLSDKSNKPSPLYWSNGQVIVKQKAAQMWCLTRLIFLILGNFIRNGCEYWQLLLYLAEICELASAPQHSGETIGYLEGTVIDFLELYSLLFPHEHFTPKMHYLQHYSKLIQYFGPLSNCWTLRYEAKHSFFKGIIRSTQNMKNVVYTLTNRHQMKQAVCLSEEEILSDEVVHKGGKCVNVSDLEEAQQQVLRDRFGDVTSVYTVNTVHTNQREFTGGCTFASGIRNSLCQFSELKEIIIEKGTVYFVVEKLQTISFDQHYHSYIVQKNPTEPLEVITPFQLIDSYPLPVYTIHDGTKTNNFIVMKYKLSGCLL